ncbi:MULTISPECIES: cobalt-precorrin-5B (C(1))-methyltransferase [Pacificibacter]|uniref:cobalt-precorrin-5B (C(1))-methyltransferase n=1 Tax=Pacificibacter TaxID=1042323 RepID=UPI001C09AA2A|nr:MULTISPECIES: cobalt-precorrin-5B (C(1))-methyltransferase [Pacificibacter]MBU2936893.1 cobalt-precorrin-5B (C(1))-methyltransferase [Pacificibacter marinus]MDO6614887.1 cobalt-precorrin-5B (C(1))-methyltransferase [Pacificibacter sp. 1_MG-2023]
MTNTPTPLRRGWTTGACATAATRAALMQLWGEGFPDKARITLPKGERPEFALSYTATGTEQGAGWAEAGIIKDAGDDPDVTHGAEIRARVSRSTGGVVFKAGEGVGTVTKAGLPIGVGEPAINPVPREMMTAQVTEMAARLGQSPDVEITISIPDGAEIALKTWNPRLGILGGLSVLGTTGVVRPFSCAAWIASIHRGVDVARAEGLSHLSGCTGATSERIVQAHHGLTDAAMLDMGDFVGGMLKYIVKHPVPRVTIGGGIGKIAKLAQGEMDLHSKRGQVDLQFWADRLDLPDIASANTALEASQIAGPIFAKTVAETALDTVNARFKTGCDGATIQYDIVVIDRAGAILATAS